MVYIYIYTYVCVCVCMGFYYLRWVQMELTSLTNRIPPPLDSWHEYVLLALLYLKG